MRAKRVFLPVVLTLIAGVTGAVAGEPAAAPPALEPGATTTSVDQAAVTPWINNAMAEPMRHKLEVAFDLALRRVREVPACAHLFHRLGADGASALSQELYFPLELRRERAVCRRASAVTSVGKRPVKLCRHFAELSDSHAAMLLIHEALHLAGLTERPHDPAAMSGAAINRMVTDACDLDRGQAREEALDDDSTT
jgi:hypothetical protein